MSRKCFVQNCRTDYDDCRPKATLFKPPSDPDRFSEWARAIPHGHRPFRPSDYICEKHFPDSMIRRGRYYGELNGKVILDAPKRPLLVPDAVPCIFVSPPTPVTPVSPKKRKMLSSKGKKASSKRRMGVGARSTSKRKSQNDQSSAVLSSAGEDSIAAPINLASNTNASTYDVTNRSEGGGPHANLSVANGTGGPTELQEATLTSTVCSQDSIMHLESHKLNALTVPRGQTEHCSFHDVLRNASAVQLPSEDWSLSIRQTEGNQSICFREMKVCSAASGTELPSKLLRVVPDRNRTGNYEVEAYLEDQQVNITLVTGGQVPQTLADISEVLATFDRLFICKGGPQKNASLGIQPECAYVDRTGLWRHARCPLLEKLTDQCKLCRSLDNSIRIHKALQALQGKRIKLKSAENKKKLEHLEDEVRSNRGSHQRQSPNKSHC